jgi:hypothetical protein
MSNRENENGKSGSFDVFTLAAAALAIGGTVLALLLMPAHATSEASSEKTESHAAVGDGAGYLPAQVVNQAKEIQPLPQQF